MLVLSRQRDESIIIGDNIVVTIVDIRGDKVRLGINAPTEIPVHRQKVYEAIQRENPRSPRLDPKAAQSFGRGTWPTPTQNPGTSPKTKALRPAATKASAYKFAGPAGLALSCAAG